MNQKFSTAYSDFQGLGVEVRVVVKVGGNGDEGRDVGVLGVDPGQNFHRRSILIKIIAGAKVWVLENTVFCAVLSLRSCEDDPG